MKSKIKSILQISILVLVIASIGLSFTLLLGEAKRSKQLDDLKTAYEQIEVQQPETVLEAEAENVQETVYEDSAKDQAGIQAGVGSETVGGDGNTSTAGKDASPEIQAANPTGKDTSVETNSTGVTGKNPSSQTPALSTVRKDSVTEGSSSTADTKENIGNIQAATSGIEEAAQGAGDQKQEQGLSDISPILSGREVYERDPHKQMDVLSLEYPGAVYCGEIAAPRKYEDEQVVALLEDRAQESEVTASILSRWNYEKYPIKLLSMMANNPEVTNSLFHFVDPDYVANPVLTEAEKAMECPLFLQWDPRWAYSPYGSNYISIAGCGPTCVSMVVYSLTRQDYVTPNFIGDIAMKYEYYVKGTGTLWKLIDEVPELYGVYSDLMNVSETNMKSELDRGNMLILSMDVGDFTSIGHFIVVYGYDDTGFFVNDPNCAYRSTRTWDYATLKKQIKGAFTLGLEPAPEDILQ